MNPQPPEPPPSPEASPEPQPKTNAPPLPDRPGIHDLFEGLLRQPAEVARHAAADSLPAIRSYAVITVASLAVFGLVLGTFSYHEQLWAAPLKVIAGLLFAGVICFPSLYIFSCLGGSRASTRRLAALLGGMLALAGLLLLGFAPAVWIFTQGTTSFGFMGFLTITSWLLALGFAFRFMGSALKEHGATRFTPITIWCGVFLLVTLQLTTSLRPILGRSDRFLTDEKKFFLQHWVETVDDTIPTTAEVESRGSEGGRDGRWKENPNLD